MADIELVIKISEDSYKATCNGYMLSSDVEDVVNAIKNGTPLPKGHGRLIDEKEVKKMIEEAKVNSEHSKTFAENIIKFAPTIIEADKAESEDNK